MRPQILWNKGPEKGKPVLLNEMELLRATALQSKISNDLGFDIDITTLTTIVKKITEQKFYKIAPAEYVPIRVGQGSWSESLLTYLQYDLADDFAAGIVNQASDNTRLSQADTGVSSVSVPVINWAKKISWSIMQLAQAAKAGNWDLVTAKEISRKRNWDLGIQKVAFLGIPSNPEVNGLLDMPGVTVNTTYLTVPINTLNAVPATLTSFIQGLLNVYRSNANRTAFPTHFVIPESDYLGLAGPSSPSFPLKSILQLLLETFQVMTGNADFKILPLAYADAAYHADNSTIAGKQVYALYNYDDASLRMDIPVDYTNTLANSIDNFSFQNVGYGQFTGVVPYRPAEAIYFQF